jgi:hypothetical protein
MAFKSTQMGQKNRQTDVNPEPEKKQSRVPSKAPSKEIFDFGDMDALLIEDKDLENPG